MLLPSLFANTEYFFLIFSNLKCIKWHLSNLTFLEKAMATHSSTLAWKIPWMDESGRLQSMRSLSRTRLSSFTFIFYFHALEKGMATHASVLAWRIPGTGEPAGLPSMGLHRVGHDWSNLAEAAAAAAAATWLFSLPLILTSFYNISATCFSVECLFTFLLHYFIRLFLFFLLIWENVLNIMAKKPLCT